MAVGLEPSRQAAPATPRALAALWRPAVAARDLGLERRPPARPAASVPSGVGGRRCAPASSHVADGCRGPAPLRDHDERRASRPAGARAPRRRHRPRSPRSDDREVALAAAPPRPADPGLERRDHRLAVGEHVGVVPLGGGEDDDVGPVRVEVAGVLVGLHDERRRRAPARRRRRAMPGDGRRAAARRRTQPGPRPRRTSDVDQPARRGALAVGPRDARRAAGRRPRRRRPAATARAGCRRRARRRARGGPGRSPSAPWSRRAAPGCGPAVTWAASWLPRDRDPGGLERRRVRRRAARVAAVTVGARRGGEQRRRRCPGARGPHDVDPLAGPDRPRRTRRARARRRSRPRRARSRRSAPQRSVACASSISRAAARARRACSRSIAGHRNRRTSPGRPGNGRRTSSPTGLASEPPSGPATPVTPTRRGPRRGDPRAPRPSPARPGRDTAPCAASTSAGHAEHAPP